MSHEKTRRMIAAVQVDLPEHAEETPWTPKVLREAEMAAPMPIRFREAPAPPQNKRSAPKAAPTQVVESKKEDELVPQHPIRADELFEQIAQRRPQDVARVVETVLLENADGMRRDIAVLIIGLGDRRAAEILKYVSWNHVQLIASCVADFDTILERDKSEVFERFRQRLLSGDVILHGGASFARKMLQRALGPQQADQVMAHLDQGEKGGFALIKEIDPEQLAPFVAKEHPQTQALILSQLDTPQAADVLNRLDAELQADVIYRLAKMDTISPQTMRNLEGNLSNELQSVIRGQITQIGGPKCVAEILNQASRTTEKNAIEQLDHEDNKLAELVRNQMFVFEDLARLLEKDLQRVVQDVSAVDLAVALRNASEALRNRVISCLSADIKTNVEDMLKNGEPVRLSRVEEVQLRLVQNARQLDEAGEITIMRSSSEDVFV